MCSETLTRGGDQLGVDLALVLLVVALQLVKLNGHDGPLWGEALPERLAHARMSAITTEMFFKPAERITPERRLNMCGS